MRLTPTFHGCARRETPFRPSGRSTTNELPSRGKKALVKRARPATSTTRQAGGNKSRSKRPVAHPKGKKRLGEPAAWVSSAPIPMPEHLEQPATVQPENTTPQNVAITRLPASRRIRSFRSDGHRTANWAMRTKPAPIQPAIALAGPRMLGSWWFPPIRFSGNGSRLHSLRFGGHA